MKINKRKILHDIELQYRKERKLNPAYPDHICGMSNKVSIAAGELSKSADEVKYYTSTCEAVYELQKDAVYENAIKLMAVTMRMLQNLKKIN